MTIKTKSLLALSLIMAFSGMANAEEKSAVKDSGTITINNNAVLNTNCTPNGVESRDKSGKDLICMGGLWLKKLPDEKKEEKKPKFIMSKGTAYQQLSYDLRKEGYKLSWNLKSDAPVKPKEYKIWQEETLDIMSQLNTFFNTSDTDGSRIHALVCPQLKYVVVTQEKNAGMIFDKDRRGCNLLSAAPEEDKAKNFYEQNQQQPVNAQQQSQQQNVPLANQAYTPSNLQENNSGSLVAQPDLDFK